MYHYLILLTLLVFGSLCNKTKLSNYQLY